MVSIQQKNQLNAFLRSANIERGFNVSQDGKIKLTGGEEAKLEAHIGRLPEAERTQAFQLLNLFKDRFELPTKKALVELFPPAQREQLVAGARTRTASSLAAERATKPPTVNEKDLAEHKALEDQIAKDGGAALGNEAKAATRTVIEDKGVQTTPEARKAHVRDIAQSGEASDQTFVRAPEDSIGALLSQNMSFEKLLAKVMLFFATQMHGEVKDKIRELDQASKRETGQQAGGDPKAQKTLQDLTAFADKMPKTLQTRVAIDLQADLQKNGIKAEGPLADWLNKLKDQPAPPRTEGVVVDNPSAPKPSNPVVQQMLASDNPKVRMMGQVFVAADAKRSLDNITSPDQITPETVEKMKTLRGAMDALRPHLPEDVQNGIKAIQVSELGVEPPAKSRQALFEELKMLQNEYMQFMQAMSAVLGQMHDMAMTTIRKIN